MFFYLVFKEKMYYQKTVREFAADGEIDTAKMYQL